MRKLRLGSNWILLFRLSTIVLGLLGLTLRPMILTLGYITFLNKFCIKDPGGPVKDYWRWQGMVTLSCTCHYHKGRIHLWLEALRAREFAEKKPDHTADFGHCFTPWWLRGKESACQCRRCKRPRFSPWVRKIPWRRKWQPTPVFLPGEFYGQRSLAGYSPWGRKRVGRELAPEQQMTHHWSCFFY